MDTTIFVSSDEELVNSVNSIIGIFESIDCEFAIFGSIGIQSYFEHFYRMPTDIDIVVYKNDVQKIARLFKSKAYEIVEGLGRYKIIFPDLSIHLIPEVLSLTDKSSSKILAKIDLASSLSNVVSNPLRLLYSEKSPQIKVLPLEMLLFIEIQRPVYTGSIITLFFVFRDLVIDFLKFKLIVKQNATFYQLILNRLSEYSIKISSLKFFSKNDIQVVRNNIENLIIYIQTK